MAVPGFDDPAVASLAAGGNLYFAADQAVASKLTGDWPRSEGAARGQQADQKGAVSLMFGEGEAITSSGEAVVSSANSSRGHVSEILNFRGSPAPWILIGLLLAAGLLHLQAGESLKGSL